MEHFMSCKANENISHEYDWKDVLENDVGKQYEVAPIMHDRQNHREAIMKGGWPLQPGSRAPEH